MRKDRSLSVCPKAEEVRHRLPAPPGREGILVRCSVLETESWLPVLTEYWEGSVSCA